MKRKTPSTRGKKTHGRTASTAKGADTHVEIQRQIRNVGTNRAIGSSDHLHRGDRRNTSSGQQK